jgi:hypothetical protein
MPRLGPLPKPLDLSQRSGCAGTSGNQLVCVFQGQVLISLPVMGARWKRTNVRAERGNHGVREFNGFINLFRPCPARSRELDFHGLQGLV